MLLADAGAVAPKGGDGLVWLGRCARCLLALLLASLLYLPAALAQRPMRVEDLFALEQLGSIVASPDGKWLAVVIIRPAVPRRAYRDFPFDLDHADVWVIDRRTGQRRNITNGAADDSGYWNPVWSPDSRRLAILSTQGADNVRPYVWESATGEVRRLTDRGADLQAYGDAGFPAYAMLWLGNTTLLCALASSEQPPGSSWLIKVRSFRSAVGEWSKAERGALPTASVLESGNERADSQRPTGDLVAIDIASTSVQIVLHGNVRRLLVSPTGHDLAVIIEAGRVSPRPGRRIPYLKRMFGLRRTRLALVRLRLRRGTPQSLSVLWIDIPDPVLSGLSDPTGPHRWSPEGTYLAVIGKGDPDDEVATQLWIVSCRTGRARRVLARGVAAGAAAWAGGGSLLARVSARVVHGDVADSTRDDWWTVDLQEGTAVTNLSATLPDVPQDLLPTVRPNIVIGIAGGKLLAIDVQRGNSAALAGENDQSLIRFAWPLGPKALASQFGDVIVQAKDNALFRIVSTGAGLTLTRLPRPRLDAALAYFDPGLQVTVFSATARDGAFVWTLNPDDGRYNTVVSLNTAFREVADAKRVFVTYRGTDGDTLGALLLLPIGYRVGTRYPLVVYAYAGVVMTDTLSYGWAFEKSLVSALNVHLLTAHGYAVLVPSIPLTDQGAAGDPLLDIPKGVIPAVDKVIDMGIADSQRVGLMGHSYGGYTAYCLLAVTKRFKAAIAMAGPSDLLSIYGTFFTPDRYTELVHEDLLFAALAESGQLRMGAPPWENADHYLRNSPLLYAGRVQTPLMIVQGDLDYIPLSQGEEFFTALYRSGKPATFVRYWGEGHVITSPANIRDLWQRIYAWFDHYLQPATPHNAIGAAPH
jgi:dipeptidyl aminopeptidase/acylaminoacyl peptidase